MSLHPVRLYPLCRGAVFALLLVAAPIHAEEIYSRPGVLHLSLRTAIKMALQKNYSIFVESFNPKIAEQDVVHEQGAFDPLLELGASRAETKLRREFKDGNLLLVDKDQRKDVFLDATISGKTAIGSEYRFGLGSTNDVLFPSQTFDNIGSKAGIKLTQPLLNNFGLGPNLFKIRIARSNLLISEWKLRLQVIDRLTELIYVYNDLHAETENFRVAERSQGLARQLLNDNTQRASIGVMSPLDVTTARADVAAREEDVILAKRKQLDNENLLKQLVTRDLEQMLEIRVEIETPPSPVVRFNVRDGIRDAMMLQPEYRQKILELEQKHISVAFSKNQALPKFDLVGSLNLLGLDDDFATSLGRIGKRDSTEWQAGFLFSYPLGNRVARSDLQSSQLEAAQALVSLQQKEQDIIVKVDNAGGQVVSNRARIETTMEASRLAYESLDAGEQRLRAGTGTTFEVLELQKKMAEAQYAEVRARADYNKSVAEYYRQTGTTLRVFDVDIR